MISFAKVTKSAYNALTPVQDRLYLIEDTGEQFLNGKAYVGEDGSRDWLCFTAGQANASLAFVKYGSPSAISLEYSTDGINWSAYDYSDPNNPQFITLANLGDRVYFRGDNEVFSFNNSNYYHFYFESEIYASGNAMSLLSKDCSKKSFLSTGQRFQRLFVNCVGLKSAPKLPATTLANYTYNNMFNGCTNLIYPPELPAMSVGNGAYANMFQGCTSLKKCPELPATSVGTDGYYSMFDGCTSITEAPELPATSLDMQSYIHMFQDCTSLQTAPTVLPANEVPSFCYQGMFYGCTNLRTAPIIKATTVYGNGCEEMFRNCSNVNIPKNIISSVTTINGFYAFSRMFQDCKAMTEAPDIPNVTLQPYCFYYMFAGNPIKKAPTLPATTLAEGCYQDMFMWCTALKEAPALPATTGVAYCYREMFYHCTALLKCEIGLTTLATDCCRDMFKDCPSISFLKVAFTDWSSANNATYWWLGNAFNTSRCLFACPTALDVSTRDVSTVPSAWNICRYNGTQGYATPDSETSYNYVYVSPYNGQLYFTQGSQMIMTAISSDCSFNAACGTNSEYGYRELYLYHQSGTISEGTDMTFEDDISDTGYYYVCIIKFFLGRAKLYVINKSTTYGF